MFEVATRDRAVRHRGPYCHRPDPPGPPPCPGCNSPLEAGPTELGELVGVCLNPGCPEFVVIFRRADGGQGRWIVAERVRQSAG